MKSGKKLLALLLCLCMLLSIGAAGITASAQEIQWPETIYQYMKDQDTGVAQGTVVYSRHGLYLCTTALGNTWGTVPYEKDQWGYGHGCFEKLGDVVEFSSAQSNSIEVGAYVHYDGKLYITDYAIANTATADLPPVNSCFRFLSNLVKYDKIDAPEVTPDYSGPYFLDKNYTVQEIESSVHYMGEWSENPCVINGKEYNKYPIGGVVKYEGKYYECVIDGAAMWIGWQPTGTQSQYWVKIALPGEELSGYVPPEEEEDPDKEQLPSTAKDADGKINGKEIIAYYPNWGVYSGYTPDTIDWNRTTIINHSFAMVGTQQNYETNGLAGDGGPAGDDAHFIVKLSDPWCEVDMPMEHSKEVGLNGIFGEYKWYKENGHDDVKIYLSVGGWSFSFYFSEMVATKENRTEFIQSCMDFLDQYPFFDGFDFDWEYPGVGRTVRDLKGNGNGYWPLVTGAPQDKENFTLFLKEMCEALDAREAKDNKEYGITACFAPTADNSAYHEFDKIVNYLDYFNIMTYCFAAPAYTGKMTGHGSNLYKTPYTSYSTEEAVALFLSRGVPASKINIGASFTTASWAGAQKDAQGNVVNVPSDNKPGPNDQKFYADVAAMVAKGQFIQGFDEAAQAGYFYNPATHEYLTVDDVPSLKAKAGYVNDNNLAGVIVWESRGDYAKGKALRHPLMDALYESFIKGISAPGKPWTKGDINHDGKVDIADATMALNAVSGKVTLNEKQTEYGDVTGDGKLTIADAMKILNFVSGKIKTL